MVFVALQWCVPDVIKLFVKDDDEELRLVSLFYLFRSKSLEKSLLDG